MRGPNITPGYWRQPRADRAGVRRGRLLQARRRAQVRGSRRPARQGLLFDGRIAEDFKLATGTWVSVGPLRARLLAQLAPYAARRGDRRRRPRRDRRADLPGSRGLPTLPRPAARRAAGRDRRSARARTRFAAGSPRFARTATGSSNRIVPRHPARRAALARRRRDHRQGLDQPARGAPPPRRPGGRALRADAASPRHAGHRRRTCRLGG